MAVGVAQKTALALAEALSTETVIAAAVARPYLQPRDTVSLSPGRRVVAVGDPQAPLQKFLEILEGRNLLGDDGWLAADVHLISMGDHFDFGAFEDRQQNGQSGLRLLRWLAAHEPSRVTLLVGNHDLARVGELVAFDDEQFQAAASWAWELYRVGGKSQPGKVRDFLARYPAFNRVEVAARDLSTFSVEQRDLVTALLRTGRFRMALNVGGYLLSHAGITVDQLQPLGIPARSGCDARRVATRLNQQLARAVERWWASSARRPLRIPWLHRPGSATTGESSGMLFHRAVHPAMAPLSPRGAAPQYPERIGRRYDPRQLPRGLVQVIGHVPDSKSRQLLGPWVQDHANRPGALRRLTVQGNSVSYHSGLGAMDAPGATSAHVIFTDGRMLRTQATEYELLDLSTLQPLASR